jgi:predicted TIM-barrel fold metal-dependent hydrolase
VVVSADVPHPEARENCMAEIAERADLAPAVKEKILTHNPARLFGIDLAAWQRTAAGQMARGGHSSGA